MLEEFWDGAPVGGEGFERTVIVEYFSTLDDPRQQGKVVYPLVEVLILVLMAVLAGAEGFTEVESFGKAKLGLLRRFARFEAGTPPHDTLGDIFAALDYEAFQKCFAAWAARFVGVPEGVVAIDGKTARRTFKKARGEAAIHMVTAYAAERRLVLGQVKTEEKSNEITAIPKLLDALSIAGATVTIDAMGCQREIAQKVVDKDAEYVLAVKGNQPATYQSIEMVRRRTERLRLQGCEGRSKHDCRGRSWPHRNTHGHGLPGRRMAARARQVAGTEERHQSRKPPRNRDEGRNRSALLSRFHRAHRPCRREDRALPLGHRELLALGARRRHARR